MIAFSLLSVAPALRTFTIICAVVAIVETVRPGARRTRIWGRLSNIAVLAINLAGFGLLLDVWPSLLHAVPTTGLFGSLIDPAFRDSVLGTVVTTAAYGLVWDVFQYWSHRALHEIPALWPIHAVHHSDPSMNATTSGRHSFVETVFGFLTMHVPTIAVVGPSMLTLVGGTVLFGGWGYLNHANVRLRFGPLTGWLSGPQLHRLHHGRDRRYWDTNYAAFFPVLDRAFGTQLLPQADEWPETGIDHATGHVLVRMLWPWRRPVVPQPRQVPGKAPALTLPPT